MPTILDTLDKHAVHAPERIALRFLSTGDVDGEILSLTYAGLRHQAMHVAALLHRRGVKAGDRVLLLHETGLDYVTSLLGCLYAGAVCVPTMAPRSHRADRAMPRLQALVASAGCTAVLASSQIAEALAPVCTSISGFPHLKWVPPPAPGQELDPDWVAPRRAPSDLAYLQYTSGSTGVPKGVMISYGNLMASYEDLRATGEFGEELQYINWMPCFHDGGLVLGLLIPLSFGACSTFMDPLAFLERPARWLEAVTHFGGTHTTSPSFGFALAVKQIPEAEWARLDLRTLRVVYNGAEPVSPEVMQAFIRRATLAGFDPRAMRPAYAMAEATLQVSYPREQSGEPRLLHLDSELLKQGIVRSMPSGGAACAVPCGRPALGLQIAIVDPHTRTRCPADRIGEIWIRGALVGGGYWALPQESEDTFQAQIAGEADARWLRTGDLGFIDDGCIVVTGRLKDLIIVAGRNLYPQDLEWAAERAHPAVRPGCCAAFSVALADGSEGIGLAAEIRPDSAAQADDIVRAVRLALGVFGAAPAVVHLLKRGAICKTSSGKVQRRATCEAIANGTAVPITSSWMAEARPEIAATSRRALGHDLGAWIACATGVSAIPLRPEATLDELGLDSMRKIALRDHIVATYGVTIKMADLAADPTLDELVAYLDRERSGIAALSDPAAPRPTNRAAPSGARTRTSEPPGRAVQAEVPRSDNRALVLPEPAWLQEQAPGLPSRRSEALGKSQQLLRVAQGPTLVLADFHTFHDHLVIPQRRLNDYIAWLMATADCVRSKTRTAADSKRIYEETRALFARYAVSEHHIRGRVMLSIPQSFREGALDPHTPYAEVLSNLDSEPRGQDLGTRMRWYADQVRAFLEEAYKDPDPASAPDDIVHVSCSGYAAPSPVERMLSDRRWGRTVVTNSYHMGCYGAFPGTRIATGLLSANAMGVGRPKRRVDVLHTELLSAHLDVSDRSPGNIVTMTLFGDGFIRYSMAPSDAPRSGCGLELRAAAQVILPGSLEEMTWSLTSHPFVMFLSPEVPIYIRDHLPGLMDELADQVGCPTRALLDAAVFAIHPGGPRIVEFIQKQLDIPYARCAHSWNVLRSRGNLSSTTVPTIWKGIVEDESIPIGTPVVSMAFGPGLTAAAQVSVKVGPR